MGQPAAALVCHFDYFESKSPKFWIHKKSIGANTTYCSIVYESKCKLFDLSTVVVLSGLCTVSKSMCSSIIRVYLTLSVFLESRRIQAVFSTLHQSQYHPSIQEIPIHIFHEGNVMWISLPFHWFLKRYCDPVYL